MNNEPPMLPEQIRALLPDTEIIDIGDVRLHLATGKITRKISLDGKVVAEPEFPTAEIDWDIIADALS